jgi:hypothetical protein
MLHFPRARVDLKPQIVVYSDLPQGYDVNGSMTVSKTVREGSNPSTPAKEPVSLVLLFFVQKRIAVSY